MLDALREIESGFKTQDVNGQTKRVKDVAFADDLISVTGSMEKLQEKADVMAAWCLVSGVEIAVKKLRTFGKEWGIKKGGGRTVEILQKDKKKKKWKSKMMA